MECFPFKSPEDIERLDLDLQSFLTLTQVSRPGLLICVGKAPAAHWIWVLVGPKDGLDGLEKKNISSPCWNSNPRSPSPETSLSLRLNSKRTKQIKNASIWNVND